MNAMVQISLIRDVHQISLFSVVQDVYYLRKCQMQQQCFRVKHLLDGSVYENWVRGLKSKRYCEKERFKMWIKRATWLMDCKDIMLVCQCSLLFVHVYFKTDLMSILSTNLTQAKLAGWHVCLSHLSAWRKKKQDLAWHLAHETE